MDDRVINGCVLSVRESLAVRLCYCSVASSGRVFLIFAFGVAASRVIVLWGASLCSSAEKGSP